MKRAATIPSFANLPKTYAGLVTLHPPRPLHDAVAYENAVEVVHALAGHRLNRDQDDYLEFMARLVEDYEREHVPEPPPAPGIETLKFLLQEHALSAEDLGAIIGVNRSVAYRILKGTRNLTLGHIRKLSARFAVSADLFLAR